MTKLILRLLISGAIVAGIVVAVIFIFFQPAKLEDAYNNIHSGIKAEGEITQLVDYLNKDIIKDKINQSYGKELVVFAGELDTLTDNYSKLQSVKDKESKLGDDLAESVGDYLEGVKEINKALKSIEDSANVSTVNQDVLQQMVDQSKSKFIKQNKLLNNVNDLLIDVLLDTYYNNVYDLSIALDETSTVLAGQYYAFDPAALKPEEIEKIAEYTEKRTSALSKYETIVGITDTEIEVMLDASDDQPGNPQDYSNSTTYFVYNLNKIDLNKLLNVADYINTLEDDAKVVAVNIDAYITNIESYIAQVRARIQDALNQQ